MAGARDGALLRRSLEIGVYLPFSASNSANSSSIASEALMTVAGVAVSLCSLQKMDAPRATHHSVSGRALGPIGKESREGGAMPDLERRPIRCKLGSQPLNRLVGSLVQPDAYAAQRSGGATERRRRMQ